MFIQVIQGKCSRQDEMRALADRWSTEMAPHAIGWLGGTYGFTDDGDMIAVVRFESLEAAQANAARPEQQAWWAQMEQLFDSPPEFHDSDRVLMMMDGGSDEAGFVQVIRGRLRDPDALEAGLHDMETMLHEARPEILGATFAIEPDGSFIETVAFTDEAAAREGEAKAAPDTGAAAEAMRSWEQMVSDMQFMDLHHPWFATRA
ncbi:hypothetical protein [Nocardioides mesophilus]|uniref:NIPSNAP family protein n=1 Tax=Nocardioides mesophilus TaxID=433659 RepID=A0A7G9RDU8_9ACTN|nr:hypothetical protein [Nocardioides mesophilus]QNN53773.1 hypothetical protein H9L09_05015 [Nocardioides mesophilus]